MREILFRGKRPIIKDWVYGTGLLFDSINTWIVGNSSLKAIAFGEERHIVIPETVGQYTGLTDKNGTNIFEGDIVKGSWNTNLQIYYDDWYLGFRAKDKNGYCDTIDYYGLDKLEVIGNIHDNPELLGGDN